MDDILKRYDRTNYQLAEGTDRQNSRRRYTKQSFPNNNIHDDRFTSNERIQNDKTSDDKVAHNIRPKNENTLFFFYKNNFIRTSRLKLA